jgi:release factor glutamine methyltransferase
VRQQEAVLQAAANRLIKGEPLPYVLGHWEFYGLTFSVSPAALIPRPETELLVELAMDWLHSHPGKRRVIDVGTGTGCIAVALAANVQDLRVLACDISHPALKLSLENASRHRVSDRIDFIQTDLLPAINRQVDLICANLPYIPSPRLKSLQVAQNEPRLALDGGKDGLKLIKELLALSNDVLSPGGLMLLEIDETHGEQVLSLAEEHFSKNRCKSASRFNRAGSNPPNTNCININSC